MRFSLPERHLARLPEPLRELRVLLAILMVAASAWLFAELAGEIMEGEHLAFDQSVLLLFRNPADVTDPIGPPWMESMVRDITAVGGTVNLTFITLSTAIFLALSGKRSSARFLLIAVGGAMLLSFGLKAGFDRVRPDLGIHGVHVYTASFPSGHATGSAATFLTLGALLARFQPRRRLKVFLLTLAVFITLSVGMSRVYLGVHWPSDVLAGWTLGASWALICWLVARWMQQRGAVEAPEETTSPTPTA